MEIANKDSLKLYTLSFVPFIMVLGNSLLIPAFPQIQEALNITQFEVGLLITVFSISAGVTIPIVGFLSDKIGRKIIIIIALFLYALGGLISGFAALLMEDPYTIMLGGRLIQGFGAGGTGPIAMALAGDLFQESKRTKAMGVLEAFNGLGKIVSPILGAVIVVLFWFSPFFVYPVLAIPVIIFMWIVINEPENKSTGADSKNSFNDYFSGIGNIFKKQGWYLIGTYLAGFSVLFFLFGTLSYMSDILEIRYGLFGVLKGVVLAIPVIVMATTSYTIGKVIKTDRSLMEYAVVGGLLFGSIAFLFIALFIESDYVFFAAIVLAGISAGVILTSVNTLVTSSTTGRARGGVTSLYGSVRFFGVAAGPPAFGWMVQVSRIFMFGMAAGFLLLMTIFSYIVILVVNNQSEDVDISVNAGGKLKSIRDKLTSLIGGKNRVK
ncbi:MFS transporter [Natranaerofaba carboxydovora]|uniref:MFS transporter n=1 Tax=Natranaerofaba carboxydovora TaxID=2742683 RepID=UPI001F13097D|nr:MFS transporter [Natranaerofaba carboxydovora]UMZ74077.1 Bacillibactin exporter [Natranaerofaba carboxydovora]